MTTNKTHSSLVGTLFTKETSKFIFDRIASAVMLMIAFPLMLVIYLIVKIEQPSFSPFFVQERVGKDGVIFKIFKFRTLDESYSYVSSVSIAKVIKTTAFGGFLRRTKLNELPQLWNVLKGDMSLVGPRPDVPGYADMLHGRDRQILRMRPGLTGPATLKYREEETLLSQQANPLLYNDEVIYPDKVRINLYYLHNHNLISDLKIIWCTVTGMKLKYNGEII